MYEKSIESTLEDMKMLAFIRSFAIFMVFHLVVRQKSQRNQTKAEQAAASVCFRSNGSFGASQVTRRKPGSRIGSRKNVKRQRVEVSGSAPAA